MTIHDEICAKAFNTELNSFVQFYGGEASGRSRCC